MEVKLENFAWANIVNKTALRRMDTLIRHIDPPAKHDALRCRFWVWVCFFRFSGFRLLMFIIRFWFWFSPYNLKVKQK